MKMFILLMSCTPAQALIITSTVPGSIACRVSVNGTTQGEVKLNQGTSATFVGFDDYLCEVIVKSAFGAGEQAVLHDYSGRPQTYPLVSFENIGVKVLIVRVPGNSKISIDPENDKQLGVVVHE